ncbi:peptidylprolyl isomerase [Lysinibacillus tabacifolii]|uniref:Peptidylprolyl isomerase n=2 Tax=Lysinibacillus tabacifolii TaxID=1173107 RepID=A0ABY2SWK9_9BACI|nr:peptidylprolyl isomerase [Lysinibacillus tabacifolii]
MRRQFSLMLVTAIIVAACYSKELSIIEIQSVPTKVTERINPNSTLQYIHDSEKGDAYIIFQSLETVIAQLEVKENILDIKLDSVSQENSELKQYVFKITRGDAKYDTVQVLVNGYATPFDIVSGF